MISAGSAGKTQLWFIILTNLAGLRVLINLSPVWISMKWTLVVLSLVISVLSVLSFAELTLITVLVRSVNYCSRITCLETTRWVRARKHRVPVKNSGELNWKTSKFGLLLMPLKLLTLRTLVSLGMNFSVVSRGSVILISRIRIDRVIVTSILHRILKISILAAAMTVS